MPRRRKPAGIECLVELARKAAILEQEMSTQRAAIERLMSKAVAVPLTDKADQQIVIATPRLSSPN